MRWWGWGETTEATPLSPATVALVEQALGVSSEGVTRVELHDVSLPEPSLGPEALQAIVSIVGDEHVLVDDESRIRHTRGKSTPDLLRLRAGDASDAPDAVVLPGSHDEVLSVLQACSESRVAVVPFGGGSSVVGGLTPVRSGFAGAIALDVRRLNRLVSLDEVSRTAVLEPGLLGPEAEWLLAEEGFTIGHHPQSFQYASLGGFAAARSSGQASAGYGRFDERVVGIRVATPAGSLELGRAPKSAAGPDLRQLFLGSEGAFGVITSLTVEVRPVPEVRAYEGWRFSDFSAGAGAIRRLVQDGPMPTVLRLSDEAETAVNLAAPSEVGGAQAGGGCLGIVGYEGPRDEVSNRRSEVTGVLRSLGGEVDQGAGERWEHGRYDGPYLRDALLDAGALVETLETVTWWSGIPRLYAAVRESIAAALSEQGTPPVVLCHISHVYRSGASLYFTVACKQAEDPVAQWEAAKAAASEAILAAGGSITHHHGVGRDHAPWFAREIGPLGIDALRAVKAKLDPAGVMNPGVLV